ncbi:MAG: hypothetical protein ACP5P9_10605 [Acidimicrobiales bacterium]
MVVAFDASWGAEQSSLPGPAELLAAAFTACLLKNLARARELLDFAFEGAEVEVMVPLSVRSAGPDARL